MSDAVARFSGFADLYDRARPHPPAELVELITQWVGTADPDVVDIGAGTGLSTALWPAAIGIEPSTDMRAIAVGRGLNVIDGRAEATGLPDDCADVVTASQALHWFDPATTFPEVARILRPGGVFAAFDCDWPPAIDPEVDAAYRAATERYIPLDDEKKLRPAYAEKSGHLRRLRDSGLFRHVTEVCLHHRESGDGERLLEIAGSQGGVVALRAAGVTDDELGLTALREVAQRRMSEPRTWWWTYRVRLATL